MAWSPLLWHGLLTMPSGAPLVVTGSPDHVIERSGRVTTAQRGARTSRSHRPLPRLRPRPLPEGEVTARYDMASLVMAWSPDHVIESSGRETPAKRGAADRRTTGRRRPLHDGVDSFAHLLLAVGHSCLAVRHLGLTFGHLRLAVTHLRLTIFHLGLAVGHPRMTVDHLFLAVRHPLLAVFHDFNHLDYCVDDNRRRARRRVLCHLFQGRFLRLQGHGSVGLAWSISRG